MSKHINIDEILEELYRAGTHKMYCTEPHHFRSIANTEQQLKDLMLEIIDIVEPCEPDCSEVRHAYHQGQYDMGMKLQYSLNNLFKGDKE